MKIKVQFTMDVDVEGWMEEFGEDPPEGIDAWHEAREDIKNYFISQACHVPSHLEGIVRSVTRPACRLRTVPETTYFDKD